VKGKYINCFLHRELAGLATGILPSNCIAKATSSFQGSNPGKRRPQALSGNIFFFLFVHVICCFVLSGTQDSTSPPSPSGKSLVSKFKDDFICTFKAYDKQTAKLAILSIEYEICNCIHYSLLGNILVL